jgi:hypothetical protein
MQDFMHFTGIEHPEDYRLITEEHVIAWRDDFKRRELSPRPSGANSRRSISISARRTPSSSPP